MRKSKRHSGKAIYQIAKEECDAWCKTGRQSRGTVMAILFSFCHRYTTGETIEELLDRCSSKMEADYEI